MKTASIIDRSNLLNKETAQSIIDRITVRNPERFAAAEQAMAEETELRNRMMEDLSHPCFANEIDSLCDIAQAAANTGIDISAFEAKYLCKAGYVGFLVTEHRPNIRKVRTIGYHTTMLRPGQQTRLEEFSGFAIIAVSHRICIDPPNCLGFNAAPPKWIGPACYLDGRQIETETWLMLKFLNDYTNFRNRFLDFIETQCV